MECFAVVASTTVKVATQGGQVLSRDQKEGTGIFAAERTAGPGMFAQIHYAVGGH